MKKRMLLACGLLPAFSCLAQQELPYGSFLATDTSIRWAAESDKVVALLPRTLMGSLDRFYRKGLDSGKLRTYELLGTDFKVKGGKTTNRAAAAAPAASSNAVDMERAYKDLPPAVRARFDTTRPQRFFCDTCSGADLELFQLRQLVYLKGGRFYVDNILVAPVEGAPGPEGNISWYRPFATSFYKGGTPPRSNPRDRVYLGTSTLNYQLPLGGPRRTGEERLLTPQEPNPIYPLLEAAMKGKLKLRKEGDADPKKPFVSPRNFFAEFGSTDSIPVYNINDPEKVERFQVVRSTVDPSALAIYGIEQSFYFDKRLQVLFSEVNKVTIKRLVYKEDGTVRGRRGLASIIYKAPPTTARQRVEAASVIE